jgi:hypothetical protein
MLFSGSFPDDATVTVNPQPAPSQETLANSQPSLTAVKSPDRFPAQTD